eukprot:TRINITY_DN2801_c1_g1_i1.p1 TRINITY_DN2801_c1_g1~~TRINITY_DN2801_c1_g1_i1.p1  ORF type:complete len:393 (+),score=214.04 TRINITY_DN2801_c1_g1_i1:92-1270(+)
MSLNRLLRVKNFGRSPIGNKFGNFCFSRAFSSNLVIPLPENSFTGYKCSNLPTQIETTSEEMLKLFEQMTLIRRAETAADILYKANKIKGFLHLCNGQEAITAGFEAAITKEDAIITAYRDHGTFMGRGGTATEMIAELLGRFNGCSKGKGGSMHMYRKEAHFYGGNGIVGAQVPVGAGIALAFQYLNKPNVCLSFYGDGAANQGQVFEAYNLAAIWKLPVIFICENNHYAMGTSKARSTLGTDYYKRGQYIPGVRVNGMDVYAVKAIGKWSKDWCVSGNGPLVLEIDTYRYVGHSMSDPGTTYRTREEIDNVRKTRDPIGLLKNRILELGVATEAELKNIEKKAKAEIEAAEQEAINGPEPPADQLYKDVYAEDVYIRGVELANSYNPKSN